MPDYSKGKIYKIVCNETGEIYIGSCIMDLDKRLWNHKSQRDCSATQILDRNNYEILLIENYPCKTNEELRWRERYWFDNINCINKRRPIVTEEEEKQRLEQNIQMAIQQGGIDLEDAIDIRRIKNIKLANDVLKQKRKEKQKRMDQQQQAMAASAEQAKAASAQAIAEAEMQKQQALTASNVQ